MTDAPAAAPASTDVTAAPPAAPASAPAAAPPAPNDLLTADSQVTKTPFDPAKFEFPEGVEFSDDHKGFLADVAKKYEIPQEAMKELLERYVTETKAITDGLRVQVQDGFSETTLKWKDETQNHYGDKLESAVAKARGVIDEFGGKEALDAIKMGGFGNNLAIIKMLERIGDAIGEAKPATSAGAVQTGNPLAKMYPSMFPEN